MVEPYDVELTRYANPGGTLTMDYNIEQYSSNGGSDPPRYEIAAQLITYGAPNFRRDASVDAVLAPSADVARRRMNPICAAPVVVVRNTGTDTLRSADIRYGIAGLPLATYRWTGALAFDDTVHVTLESFESAEADSATFVAVIAAANGAADEYHGNDTLATAYTVPPTLPAELALVVRTNNRGGETSYSIRDLSTGRLVLERSGLAGNTSYYDTLSLDDGCYEFRLNDTAGDGLYYWYNRAAGTGYARMSWAYTGEVVREFPNEFGRSLVMQFRASRYLPVGVGGGREESAGLAVNATTIGRDMAVRYRVPGNAPAELVVSDLLGNIVLRQAIVAAGGGATREGAMRLELPNLTAGVYLVVVRSGNQVGACKVPVQ
jgi:hypothetical protein